MGASVGVGGLIIGISMLVVFSMAVTSLSNQTATSLEVIEAAQLSNPIITIDNANLTQFAVDSITVTDSGTVGAYTAGFLTSPSCQGFNASFTLSGGVVEDTVIVISAGSCSGTPTDMVVEDQTAPADPAVFSVNTKRQLFANLTNDGTETISTDTAWLFFDGESPRTIASANTIVVQSFDNWFSGETIEIFWDNAADNERLSLSVGEISVSRTITSTT
jgi:archaellum component FlaF (FlaF/FlaG flagellin family)